MIYFLSSNIRKLKDVSFLIKKYAMTYYLFLPWKINGFVYIFCRFLHWKSSLSILHNDKKKIIIDCMEFFFI
jgi:hypothetical protein